MRRSKSFTTKFISIYRFRKTCPEVFPVSFDPLSNFIRDQIVFGGLERGCYSLSQSCFCSVSSSDALKYVISNCSEFENSKARKWLRSLCGPEPEGNTISVTTVGVVLPTNGSLAAPTTSVVIVSSVILTVCFIYSQHTSLHHS